MKMTGNTMLITGGGSGIGRGLAERLHRLGNTVVIAGRREGLLREVAAANPGMEFAVFDQETAEGVAGLAEEVQRRFPQLNVLVNNAGLQRVEDLRTGTMAEAEMTIGVNLLGPMRLTAALLGTILAQGEGAVVNVTSALGFMTSAWMPSYSASKAAMHSYTQSLRFQLRGTGVEVIEVVPPWVQTELQGERGMNPRAMPLAEYIEETMGLLGQEPTPAEVVVERAKAMRCAERGDFDAFFERYNAGWVQSQKQ